MRKLIFVSASLISAGLVWLSWSPQPAVALMSDYRDRLARTTQTDIPLELPNPVRLLTKREQRLSPLPEARTSLGKALGLGECGLVPELARVNNSLGKVAAASTQLLQTQRILALATPCQPDHSALQDSLDELIQHRRQLWPHLLNNTLIASPEWEEHFKSSTPALAPNATIDTALAGLLGWMGQQRPNQPKDPDRLIEWLGRLKDSDQGAAVLNAQRLIEGTLPAMTQALRDTPICMGPGTAEQRKLAQQVFASQYLGRVQPWLANVERGLRPVYQASPMLAELSGIERRWLATDQTLTSFQEQIKAHALAWRDLLERCGVSPSSG